MLLGCVPVHFNQYFHNGSNKIVTSTENDSSFQPLQVGTNKANDQLMTIEEHSSILLTITLGQIFAYTLQLSKVILYVSVVIPACAAALKWPKKSINQLKYVSILYIFRHVSGIVSYFQ